jgi:hypothetical protein
MIRMVCTVVALALAAPVSFGQTAAWSGYGGDPQHTALSPRISRFQRGGQNEAENDKSDSHRVTSGDSGGLQLGPIISYQSASQGYWNGAGHRHGGVSGEASRQNLACSPNK